MLSSKVVRTVREANARKGGGSGYAGSEGVNVSVRVRPFIKEEKARGSATQLCISMPTKTTVQITENPPAGKHQEFTFDRAFWSHDANHSLFATQNTIYEELGEAMLSQALDGFNTCIFAYGQTGSGKSYSVLGDDTEDGRGLLPRVVQGLFDTFHGSSSSDKYTCMVSFMEIYNEQIRDLLTDCSNGNDLKVRMHPVLGTFVVGLTEKDVTSKEEVARLIEEGTSRRTVGATAMNFGSSRSHCIFTFKTSITKADGAAKVSQTHLVDLAGSERATRTGAQGDRLKEGAAINKSLSALARVISALASNSGKKKSLPPFRDSKLTFVLKESLSGNSKTYMMAAISPSLPDFEETLSTLRFAQSVKKVQLNAVANEMNVGDEQGVAEKLRQEIAEMKLALSRQKVMKAIELARLKEKADQFKEQQLMCKSLGIDIAGLYEAQVNKGQKKSKRHNGNFETDDHDGSFEPTRSKRSLFRRLATVEIDNSAILDKMLDSDLSGDEECEESGSAESDDAEEDRGEEIEEHDQELVSNLKSIIKQQRSDIESQMTEILSLRAALEQQQRQQQQQHLQSRSPGALEEKQEHCGLILHSASASNDVKELQAALEESRLEIAHLKCQLRDASDREEGFSIGAVISNVFCASKSKPEQV
eukprot:TRINITY_DN3261_c0_g2_i1.p1 TRINITY_DN3261_c0_g2~~TRINITY_DN3261_c0_g2_i1.p1  ORF type:complete len:648 (+),score=101.19 TRINITY_DN3261_c0_g2_i1:57-2000(+)